MGYWILPMGVPDQNSCNPFVLSFSAAVPQWLKPDLFQAAYVRAKRVWVRTGRETAGPSTTLPRIPF